MIRAFSLWAPVAAWAGLIFFLSSIPDLDSGLKRDFLLRKAAHVGEYAVLAALLWRAFAARARGVGALFLLSFTLSAAYAVSDEYHQSFVPGRGPSAVDVAIDASGALAACFLLSRRQPVL